MAIQVGPGDPGAANGGLNVPPPPPPSMRTPDYSGLADNQQSNPQGVPPGGQFLAMITQQAQLVEQGAAQLAQMLPSFVPIAAQVSQMIRQAVVTAMRQVQANAGNVGGSPAAPPPGGPPQQ